ncbi:Hpt domain protein [Desulfobulbus propionicus DSM 2032]|jgi:HPt (histidine-containing phosphotransfer) domain-containing protein|uniref:Hpt domain protein n=1 Tax=Desulfobulbus propionicus (strain ATCC 33891 / DSM 2032 / VKM B-1956 / 1pr3) TaxID=577650 RepID=A0A7U4DPB0_DESPD|nr:Hpt domain-containing protein [Desulfobulbus propionicus]ADW17956.1 Hpt domain protein [Desulfobulbus propionicus DSM 2032]
MADLHWNKAFALEQTAGDEELLEELLLLFKDSSASDLEQLRRAVGAGDAEEVVRAAHSLKGAAASLGIEGIRQLAMTMETDARQGSLAVAQEKLSLMAELLDQLKNIE